MNSVFLQTLRERTARWHQALEQNPLSVQLLRDEVTLHDYRRYLEALYGFVAGFEQHVYPMLGDWFPDLSERQRTGLLADDLYHIHKNGSLPAVLPQTYFRSLYPGAYEALGGLYVMEGSTLGGQVIQRHLRKTLEDAAGQTRYFGAYGMQTGFMWKEFLSRLTAIGDAAGDRQEKIIQGALVTFQALDTEMNGKGE